MSLIIKETSKGRFLVCNGAQKPAVIVKNFATEDEALDFVKSAGNKVPPKTVKAETETDNELEATVEDSETKKQPRKRSWLDRMMYDEIEVEKK